MPRLSSLTSVNADFLRRIVGDTGVFVSPSVVRGGEIPARYALDWLKRYASSPSAVVRPRNTDEVSVC